MWKDKNKKEKEEIVKKAVPKEEKKEENVKEINNKEVKKEEPKHRIVVVSELPTQVIRESVAEDGTILHFITTQEALSELMN